MSFKVVMHTLISRFLLILVLLTMGIPLLIIIFLPKKWRYNRFVYSVINLFYWATLKSTLVPIQFKGWNNLIKTPAVFVCNHQSSLDIPILGVLSRGRQHIWLARHELLESWLFRLFLPSAAIIINVNSPKKAVRSLREAVDTAESTKSDIMIFPEGQRHTDGRVHDFFRGFVILAKQTGLPVMPVRIFNVHKIYPPNTFWVRYYPVTVIIGEPMYIQEGESDEEFKSRVHSWFLAQKD